MKTATCILHTVTEACRSLRSLIEQERQNAAVGRQIHDARSARGLSHAQLARLVGTTQSALARLEDADYEGHSLSMLRKIAAALGCQVQVKFTPSRRKGAA